MKICRNLIVALLATVLSVVAMAQNENRGFGNRGGGFQPKLEGVWQMCSLSATQDGQPQLSFLPMLKVFNEDGYQNIALPDEGGCFISKQCKIEKTSDSTFTETPMMMRRDSVQTAPVVVSFRFRGPMWLTITYTEAGKAEPTTELWMRVRPQGGRGGQMGQGGQRTPGMGRPDGQRRQQGGQRGGFNRQRMNGDFNPFEQSQGGGSISEADD